MPKLIPRPIPSQQSMPRKGMQSCKRVVFSALSVAFAPTMSDHCHNVYVCASAFIAVELIAMAFFALALIALALIALIGFDCSGIDCIDWLWFQWHWLQWHWLRWRSLHCIILCIACINLLHWIELHCNCIKLILYWIALYCIALYHTSVAQGPPRARWRRHVCMSACLLWACLCRHERVLHVKP